MVSSERAIASTTRSDGSRSPRSICDRYGLEIPAIWANWRIESRLSSRWRRMISPSENAVGSVTRSHLNEQRPAAGTGRRRVNRGREGRYALSSSRAVSA